MNKQKRDLQLLPEIEARLRELSELPRGWDGDDALPVSAKADTEIRAVLAQVYALARGRVPGPFIAPDPDGGLGIDWEVASGAELLLAVSPAGAITYLLSGPGVEKQGAITGAKDLERLLRAAGL